MLQQLIALDIELFNFINHNLQNPFFDRIMPIITTGKYWLIPLLIGCIILTVLGNEKNQKAVLMCLIALIIGGLLSDYVLKPFYHRIRPFKVLVNVHLLVRPGGYSFPSSHTVNCFVVAIVASYVWRKLWVVILSFFIASVVGFSRIYCGVHYPADVATGILVAVFASILGIEIFEGLNYISKTAGKYKIKRET